MNMTEGEICRQYRSAKDRASQLQILADLNCVPRLEIIKILMHNGEQVRLPLAAKGKKRTTELTDEEYTAALFRRLDVLDRETGISLGLYLLTGRLREMITIPDWSISTLHLRSLTMEKELEEHTPLRIRLSDQRAATVWGAALH